MPSPLGFAAALELRNKSANSKVNNVMSLKQQSKAIARLGGGKR